MTEIIPKDKKRAFYSMRGASFVVSWQERRDNYWLMCEISLSASEFLELKEARPDVEFHRMGK